MSNTTSSTITNLTSFTAGDIVISLVGDVNGAGGYTDNQATPIILEEITTAGVVVGEMELSQTTTTNSSGVVENAISGEYGSSSEGSLELSGDGESLVIAGYGINAATYNTGGAAVYGNAALAQTTSVPGGTYTPVARVIADISYNGTVDTSTALFNVFNLNNPRSVATLNGSTFYISGQGNKDATQGVFVADDGASAAITINASSDTRTVEIVNGELYVSYDSKQANPAGGGIEDFGSTLPASETSGTLLTGLGPTVSLSNGDGNGLNGSTGTAYLSPENFFFANATTLYIADGGQPKEGGAGDGGLQKWTYNTTSDTWQLDYTLTAGLNLVDNSSVSSNTDGSTGLIGMTATVNGNGTVTFYVTNSTIADLDQTSLYTITDTLADTTASQASGESFATLITAYDGSNGSATDNIRGVAFAPTAPASAPAPITVASGTTSSGVVVSSGGTLTVASGGVVSGATILSAGTAYISGADSGSYIAEGGKEIVSGGASYDTIYGQQAVVSGGVVSGEAVFNNGGIALVSGAIAQNTTVNAGGTVILSGGGTASGLTINGGTVYLDTAADALSGAVVFSGSGGEIVISGGTGTGVAVISGFNIGDEIDITNVGTAAVLASSTAGGNTVVTVSSGGVTESFVFSGTSYAAGYFELTGDPVLTVNPAVAEPNIVVSSGVTSTGLDITSGQTLTVLSGGIASNTTIGYGGSAVVSGVDSGTMVQSGGSVTVIGAEFGATISSGGSAAIAGTASGNTILAGATEYVSGAATGDVVYGTQIVSGTAVPGAVTSETVFGTLDVTTTGATATDITVSGGTIFLSKAVVLSNTTLSGGTIIMDSPKTVLSGSLDLVGSNSIIIEAANSAGYGDLAVISGFNANDKIDLTIITSSTADSITSSVVSGVTSVTVAGGGTTQTFLFAGSGGTYGLTGDGTGGVDLVSGAGTIFPAINYTVSGGQTSSGLVISSGHQLTVLSGGTAASATILSGGIATISGTDSGSNIAAGATETVIGSAVGDIVAGTQNITVSTAVIGNETVLSGGSISVGIKSVTVSGITVNSGGSLTLNGAITASNTVLSGGTVNLTSPKATLSGSLVFSGASTLEISALSSTSAGSYGDQAVISGFVQGDAIDFAAMGGTTGVTSSLVYTSGTNKTVLTVSSGGATEAFTFGGHYTSGYFSLGTDTGGHAEILGTSATVPCFAGGTRLLGIEGDVLVENVKPGDMLVTVRENGPVTRQVVWTGKRAINIARHPAPELVRPVRIIAGAFGAGLPERDLRLSPDHAVYVDGALFTAISLVNGSTIYQEQNCTHVTYHHIELESHDILLAEGLPAESFLDTGNREMFESVSGVMALHADFTARSENGFCVKLVREGEALDALRARLAERAAIKNVA
jgi:autotransporter passenger strand-loop-strand repeat protein